MRMGNVVRLRLNTKDCMTVIDLLEWADVPLSRLGISNAASIAFSLLLEEKRRSGQIPVRQGFEYESMMNKLDQSGNTKAKQAVANDIYHRTITTEEPEEIVKLPPPKAEAGVWVDDMWLPDGYQQLSGMQKVFFAQDQQALIDEGKAQMQKIDEWTPRG